MGQSDTDNDTKKPGSEARDKLLESLHEIHYLQALHVEQTGDGPGRRPPRVEVLNKACIVLICAYWEAYCEDVVAEALIFLVREVKTAKALPKDLRKQLTKKLKSRDDELAMWELAGEGWRQIALSNLVTIREKRNFTFNTPKHGLVDVLFHEGVGLANLSSYWKYNKFTAEVVRKRLDGMVELRGAIAHRGRDLKTVKKRDVEAFHDLVLRLAEKTDAAVNDHVKRALNTWLFDPMTRKKQLKFEF